jgi:serine/threonine protein kinase
MRTGNTVGRFRIGLQIGQGAFGNTYAAVDSGTGLVYAIKCESATSTRKCLSFETRIHRLIHESPYFPCLFESRESRSFTWFAMELIGPSLSSILKHTPNRKFSLSTSVWAARHCLRATEALLHMGLIHRDLKPVNILVRQSRDNSRPPICLIDFGLVRAYKDLRTDRLE